MITFHYLMTDSQLIDSLKEDGQAGFVAIYHRYYKQLLFFISRYVNDTDAAEEIVADVFVKLWSRRLDFHSMDSLRAFLYIVAKNASLNVIRTNRSRGIQEPLSAYEDMLMDDQDVFSDMIYAELIHAIFNEVEKLPEKQRAVFNLTFIEDKTVEEIAEQLQISPAAVYTNRSRAISTIKDLLGSKDALTIFAFLTLIDKN